MVRIPPHLCRLFPATRLFWILLSTILILSLIPSPPPGPELFPHFDKIQHGMAYLVLGFLRVLGSRRGGIGTALLTVLILTLIGGVIEILQGFTGRNPEWADLLADGTGAAAGSAAALFLQWKRSRD